MAMRDLLARADAANAGLREAPLEDSELPAVLEEGTPKAPDLETAIAGVESAVEGMDLDKAEKIRTHLNAIRDIAMEGEEKGVPEASPEAVLPGGERPEGVGIPT